MSPSVNREVRRVARLVFACIWISLVAADLGPRGPHVIAAALGTESLWAIGIVLAILLAVYWQVSIRSAMRQTIRVYGRTITGRDTFDAAFDEVFGYEIDWYVPFIVLSAALGVCFFLDLPSDAWRTRLAVLAGGVVADYWATALIWRVAYRILVR